MLFTYMYQSQYLLTYLMLAVLILVSSYSDQWAQILTPHFEAFFFREALRNPLLPLSHPVRTYGEISQDKSKQELRQE